MSTTTKDPVAARRARVEAERRARPEAAVWLRLLERALDAAEQPAWTGLAPRLAPTRKSDAPLLDDAIVAVDRRTAGRWVRGLVKAAAASPEAGTGAGAGASSLGGLRGRTVDALELLAAAVAEDVVYLDDVAARCLAGPDAVAAVARLAALPLLRGCAAALAGDLPVGWTRGWCPACGGWPSVAELRGLERTRVLRCGRCATGWELPVLVCPFCDERDHRNHFSFAPEGEEQQRRVDACRSCNGYIKTLTTLAPLRPWAVPLDDLATIELDLVAAERGLGRPARPGFAVALRVVAGDGPLARLRGGWS